MFQITGCGFRETANVDVEISENENTMVFWSNVGKEFREFTDKTNTGLRGSVYQ